jgi:hypothetical protein
LIAFALAGLGTARADDGLPSAWGFSTPRIAWTIPYFAANAGFTATSLSGVMLAGPSLGISAGFWQPAGPVYWGPALGLAMEPAWGHRFAGPARIEIERYATSRASVRLGMLATDQLMIYSFAGFDNTFYAKDDPYGRRAVLKPEPIVGVGAEYRLDNGASIGVSVGMKPRI